MIRLGPAGKRFAALMIVMAFAFVSFGPSIALAAEITGIAGKVVDGDTLWICDHAACTKMRLCGIDAPELSHAGGNVAKAGLQSLIGSKMITCVPVGGGTVCDGRSKPTSYDRIVAQCFVDGKDLAAAMVDEGNACDWLEFSGGAYSRRGQAVCRR